MHVELAISSTVRVLIHTHTHNFEHSFLFFHYCLGLLGRSKNEATHVRKKIKSVLHHRKDNFSQLGKFMDTGDAAKDMEM